MSVSGNNERIIIKSKGTKPIAIVLDAVNRLGNDQFSHLFIYFYEFNLFAFTVSYTVCEILELVFMAASPLYSDNSLVPFLTSFKHQHLAQMIASLPV